ncbi:MAG: hypothetical protein ABIP41_01975 [Croceibacterium sp.]
MPAAKRPATKTTARKSPPRAPHTQDKGRTTVIDRAGERAIETRDRLAAFAKDHPVATVVGGLALGVLVSGLFRGSPTRKLGKQARGLASVGAELAVAYAAQALAASEPVRKEAANRLGDLGDTALKYGKSGSETAQDVARSAGKRIAKAIHSRFN